VSGETESFVNGRAVWITVPSPYGKDSNFVSVGGSKLRHWNGLSARKRFKFGLAALKNLIAFFINTAAFHPERFPVPRYEGLFGYYC
jgi:hypothetical protein